MYSIWCERPIPPEHYHLLDGVALPIVMRASPSDGTLAEAQAIIAGARVRYNGALMDQAPALKVIARTGIGVDNIAIADATARQIAVCNAPDGPTISTAEHTICLMLAVAKQLKEAEWQLQQGQRQDYFGGHSGLELYGRTLGLVGLGRIGRHVAKIAIGIGMHVLAFDPYLSTEQCASLGVEQMTALDTLLAAADVVSLHLPLTPDTEQLMNKQRLGQMKPGAILINCARGGLVDEIALIEALDSGHLQGAGLDVFRSEPPPPNHPLLNRRDVVATAHIAGATQAGKARLWQTAIQQALLVLQGVRPPHLVNPEVWKT